MVQPAYVSDCYPPSASNLQFDFMYWDKTINKSNVLPSMVANMLALEISPQAEEGKPQGNIKPLHLVASPTGTGEGSLRSISIKIFNGRDNQ